MLVCNLFDKINMYNVKNGPVDNVEFERKSISVNEIILGK